MFLSSVRTARTILTSKHVDLVVNYPLVDVAAVKAAGFKVGGYGCGEFTGAICRTGVAQKLKAHGRWTEVTVLFDEEGERQSSP